MTQSATTWAEAPLDKAKADAYPAAKKGEVVDDYHGTKVADPYRGLEDPDSAETKAWVEAENRVTFAFLESIPARAKIKARLTQLWDYEKYGVPFHEGGRYFYTKNTGLQAQSVLYTTPSLDGEPKPLLDPNSLSKDGTVALAGTAVSDDGRRIAYGIAAAGSDWVEWHVRDVESGQDLPDVIKWVKFSGADWTKDNAGFFYGRFPEPAPGADLKGANYFQKVYHHKLGTPQAEDTLVWEDPEHKDWRADTTVSDDGAYLILTLGKGTDAKHRVLFRPMADVDAKPIHLVGEFEAQYRFIDNDGPVFFFETNKGAARGQGHRHRHPQAFGPSELEVELIPQAAETLQGVNARRRPLHRLVPQGRRRRRSSCSTSSGQISSATSSSPAWGPPAGFGGKRSGREGDVLRRSPRTLPRRRSIAMTSRLGSEQGIQAAPKVDVRPVGLRQSTQVFYTSKDGTKIPMIVSRQEGAQAGRVEPDVALRLRRVQHLADAFVQPGERSPGSRWAGVYAVPNLRGGGEYGEDWHQGGDEAQEAERLRRLHRRGRVPDLREDTRRPPSWRSPAAPTAASWSARCINQRPDLFRRRPPRRRRHGHAAAFSKFTAGKFWVDEYGSSDSMRRRLQEPLHAYSPLHNIRPNGHLVPADHGHHRRPRRPCGSRPFLQIRRHPPGKSRLLARPPS